jgi:hypothetical protein
MLYLQTLRLWPAVANGTFRELQFDDYVVGAGGEEVKLKKGTYVQVTTWPRHRNPKLWGEDCDRFNPDRDFGEDEVWGEDGFMRTTLRLSDSRPSPTDREIASARISHRWRCGR